MSSLELSPFQEVLAEFKAGRPVIMVDDNDRENEGDLVVAAEYCTAESIAFMQHEARGLICVSIAPELASHLKIPLQVHENNSPYHTAFTTSIDHKLVMDTGIEAAARAFTIRSLINETSTANDFVSPGHVFPLIANSAGVIGRRGQTEGSYDLARIANLAPAGVICEILNPDGTMSRDDQLQSFAKLHNLTITSVAEVIKYRVQHEALLQLLSQSKQITDYGEFEVFVFLDDATGKEHLAIVKGRSNFQQQAATLVRIHSECLTGDVFGSRRCDCGEQLRLAMQTIDQAGGMVIYLRQEGRGIGLINKLCAYELQDEGHDTVEANLHLGFPVDSRDFSVAAKILKYFKISNARLLTNNPDKLLALEQHGINIVERLPSHASEDKCSAKYIATKRTKLGHLV